MFGHIIFRVFILGFLKILGFVTAEITIADIDREVSDGIKSVGFNLVYGDENMMLINEVVSDAEKFNALKSKHNSMNEIEPLPPQDVKCLMSVDRYCSKDMKEIKGILVQAIKNDCQTCTTKQKEDAGKVIASMLAYDSVAWKLFLTRSALLLLPPKKSVKKEEIKLMDIGHPEYVVATKSRKLDLGFNVRVKRFVSKQIL